MNSVMLVEKDDLEELEEPFDSDDSIEDRDYDPAQDEENVFAQLANTWTTTPAGTQKEARNTCSRKNGYKWSTLPINDGGCKIASRNIVYIRPGPTNSAKYAIEPIDTFNLFFSDEILDEVFLRTNEKIAELRVRYKTKNATVSDTTLPELKALLGVNAFVIYHHNATKNRQEPLSRLNFMLKLHEQLTKPWQQIRLQTVPTLSRGLKESLSTLLHLPRAEDRRGPQGKGKRTYCSLCPTAKKRMTTTNCYKCERALCGEHQIKICMECGQ
ncbi:unnamed protein product [Acanthoscelides obtectus]|uniref:PiggyBac transposable element-derived protein domain-containing protein n=1 Tax=Acanthoscelides obtectus TaxID=200917 RepID=A0A9P0LYE6_ACAOB|nr:unnamed protein product [Acanthoscelides obtectus]CAK1627589.1 hypothetical protein AOBTE_LOCUS4686 [Acanthoscelides obtectus]